MRRKALGDIIGWCGVLVFVALLGAAIYAVYFAIRHLRIIYVP